MISPNRKKRIETVDAENLETTFNEHNDDEDDDTMDKKREEFEYSFIGTPVNQDIKVEDEDEPNEEQSKEEEEEERTEDNDQKKKKKKKKKGSTRKLPTKKRRKQIVESDDDDDSDVEIDKAEPSLKKITRKYASVPEKKYVLEKVFRTFHFLFPELHKRSDYSFSET